MPSELFQLNASNYRKVFDSIGTALLEHQRLWRPRPFTLDAVPWKDSLPGVHAALLSLNSSTLEEINGNDSSRQEWFRQHSPELVDQLNPVPIEAALDRCGSGDYVHAPRIRASKKEQIDAFVQAVPRGPEGIVDWCSGKGHLAHVLHQLTGQEVLCLERDASLCRQGEVRASETGANVRFVQCDVLQANYDALPLGGKQHVGLHACGDLHVRLLEVAVAAAASAIAIAPCCYHKTRTDIYAPMSEAGKAANLSLSRQDLHLSVEDGHTRSERTRRLRKREQVWRLAISEHLMSVSQSSLVDNNPGYKSLPSLPKSVFSGSFSDFVETCRARLGLPVVRVTDEDGLLERAEAKRQQVLRLEQLRKLFKRPLELWLVLDRAMFLEEHGYQTWISEFCPPSCTPRNLLLTARPRE